MHRAPASFDGRGRTKKSARPPGATMTRDAGAGLPELRYTPSRATRRASHGPAKERSSTPSPSALTTRQRSMARQGGAASWRAGTPDTSTVVSACGVARGIGRLRVSANARGASSTKRPVPRPLICTSSARSGSERQKPAGSRTTSTAAAACAVCSACEGCRCGWIQYVPGGWSSRSVYESTARDLGPSTRVKTSSSPGDTCSPCVWMLVWLGSRFWFSTEAPNRPASDAGVSASSAFTSVTRSVAPRSA